MIKAETLQIWYIPQNKNIILLCFEPMTFDSNHILLHYYETMYWIYKLQSMAYTYHAYSNGNTVERHYNVVQYNKILQAPLQLLRQNINQSFPQ